ncbi:hypothetical protein OPV22_023412 [Ensete ventricosum]|uniref:Uncharacterized protein n=1 Tax=Ensete ventricosum TaxID=4639 RepID=A0AAV8QNH0_ENSVE|nr:hypothetical protein OPV22_023412 [Ensete ventricosum]
MRKLFGCLARAKGVEIGKLRAFGILQGWLRKSKKPKTSAGEQPSLCEKKGGAVTLKVVMTKKEAARLFAMFVRGEEAMVAKIVDELNARTEAPRYGSSPGGAWRPILESIPEAEA